MQSGTMLDSREGLQAECGRLFAVLADREMGGFPRNTEDCVGCSNISEEIGKVRTLLPRGYQSNSLRTRGSGESAFGSDLRWT